MGFDFSSVLSWLVDGYWPEGATAVSRSEAMPERFGAYVPQRLLAVGDVTDVYLATCAEDPTWRVSQYVLKVARTAEGRLHLERERHVLERLLAAAGETTYRAYLPTLIESLGPAPASSRGVNVFRAEPGWATVEQVHERLPALDGRHLAWVFKRLLTVLGFVHRQGVLHGAVLPEHVLIHAEGHGLRLVGWGNSAAVGRRLRTVADGFAGWYPPELKRGKPAETASDLYLAAKCVVYLAGGDPLTNQIPEEVPGALRRFLGSCLLESARMRPGDAWAVQDEFDQLLRRLYGPPKFHALTLTGGDAHGNDPLV